MNNQKIILTLVAGCLVAACATPFKDYEGSAKRTAIANVCEREGYISSEAFSYYATFQMNDYPRQWTVDEQKLRSMYFEEVEKSSGWKPSPSEREQLKLMCAQIATVAERVRPKASTQQQRASEYSYTPPKTTNCMTTYGWTRCTTN